MRLFAVVAKEGDVTRQERDQIRIFLQEHLSHASVESYLNFFDEITKSPLAHVGDEEKIRQLCREINPELTQKQKIIIILDLVSIIQADGNISETEEHLVNTIGDSFKINHTEIEAIKMFVLGKTASELDHEHILLVARVHQRAVRVLRGYLIALREVDRDDVGALAGRERADARLESGRAQCVSSSQTIALASKTGPSMHERTKRGRSVWRTRTTQL